MKKPDAVATVYLTELFFELVTMSQGMLRYGEPSAPLHHLPPNASDTALGATLRIALSASKRVSVEDFQKIFHSGIIQKTGEDRTKSTMQKYGYKTKRALYKNMMCCWISVLDGKIEIAPSHHKSLDSYTATQDGPEPLFLDASISDAELGAALREGFKRCTSAVT
jgi:hypothetical protein